MTAPITTLDEYRARLKAHDWSYEMSDDHSVWQSGFNERSRLGLAQALLDPQYLIWNTLAPEQARIKPVFEIIEIAPELISTFRRLEVSIRQCAQASLSPEWEFVKRGALIITIAGAKLVVKED